MDGQSLSPTLRFVVPALVVAPLAVDAAIIYTASGDTLGFSTSPVPIQFGGTASAQLNIKGTISFSDPYIDALVLISAVGFVGNTSYRIPSALPYGYEIKGSAPFFNKVPGNFNSLVGGSGQFDDFTDERYMGVRFLEGGNTHFGWVGIIWDSLTETMTITGWAWDDQPNTPILTGAGVPVVSTASGGGAGAAAAAADANTQRNVRQQQQQQAAAARVARQKVAQQHRRNQQR